MTPTTAADGRHVAAVDQGTTGTRCLIVDREARVVADAYAPHESHHPRPGWVEHEPAAILANVRRVVRESLAEAGIEGEELAAVGIATQRETTLLWDAATGEPVDRAIVWQDRRTTDRIEALDDDERALIRERTGLAPDAYFSATKLEWLLDRDRRRERAAAGELRAGTVDAWLLARLTGAHVTDPTNASRTMLFDVEDCAWDDELLDLFSVPRACLPTVRPSSVATPYGHTDPDGAFGARVPATGALGDQQAALFGQACFEAGEAKNTYGTGSFLLTNTGTEPARSEHGLLTTVAYQLADEAPRYALEGSIFVTGAALDWLAEVGVVESAAATEALARSVDSPDGVAFVPAFAGLGAPYWDGRARGTVLGLTRGTEPAHLARAALEAIAFRTRDVVEATAADAGRPLASLRVDGGAVANDLLCRLQADALGVEVVRPAVRETTGLGAAFAAGLGVGYWDSRATLRETRRIDRRFEPGAGEEDPVALDGRYGRWGEALDRARDWARDEA